MFLKNKETAYVAEKRAPWRRSFFMFWQRRPAEGIEGATGSGRAIAKFDLGPACLSDADDTVLDSSAFFSDAQLI